MKNDLTQKQRLTNFLLGRAKLKMNSAISTFDALDKMGALSADMSSAKKVLEDIVDQIRLNTAT